MQKNLGLNFDKALAYKTVHEKFAKYLKFAKKKKKDTQLRL